MVESMPAEVVENPEPAGEAETATASVENEEKSEEPVKEEPQNA
jgi:hypothetical protein